MSTLGARTPPPRILSTPNGQPMAVAALSEGVTELHVASVISSWYIHTSNTNEAICALMRCTRTMDIQRYISIQDSTHVRMYMLQSTQNMTQPQTHHTTQWQCTPHADSVLIVALAK